MRDLLDRFHAGADLLATATAGIEPAMIDFVSAPGKWTIRQIASHLSDAELVLGDRFRRVIAEPNPTLMGFDQAAWAANLDYSKRDLSQAVENFRRMRLENYLLIKDLPQSAYARTSNHSERGPETLLKILEMYTSHAETHARQIQAIRAAYGASNG